MNKKKISTLVLSGLLALGMIVTNGANPVSVKASTNDKYNTSRYGETLDVDPILKAQDTDPNGRAKVEQDILNSAKGINLNDTSAAKADTSNPNFTYDGGTKWFLAYDNVKGDYLKKFTLRSINDKVEVWVADDLSFGKGDSRPAHVVNQEQVDKLKNEFSNNILTKDTEFFGMPKSRTGSNAVLPGKLGLPKDYYVPVDGKERFMMLVDNFKDENYYDPSYPFYVAGFFSPTFASYLDRNIINIDSAKWDQRLASNDIYGTIAHEFQHLIHNDNDNGEETWINEGMSDFAQYLCGYGHNWGHVNYFLDHPENSLVQWDEYYNSKTGPETLGDYGQAYLFQLYLYDHFGKDFIKDLAKDTDHGIVSMNKMLAKYNTGIDFAELFRRFSVAVAIDSKDPGKGIYNFKSIDAKVNYAAAKEHEKLGVPAWGADYIKLDGGKDIKDILFNGVSFVRNPNPWQVANDPKGSSDKVIWGNKVDDNDNKIAFEADLTSVKNATLKFDNYYDIEETWDYGMVQVSTDEGKTWTSLANKNTRSEFSTNGRDSIKKNLPGFTGTNGSWNQEQFDLTPYVGKKVLICFRYMTDDGTTKQGWFIKNISIPEIGYKNSCDNTNNFADLEKILGQYADYQVTFINEKQDADKVTRMSYRVKSLNPFSLESSDAIKLKKSLTAHNNYMIIWYAAPTGKKGVADCDYKIIKKEPKQNKTNH
ncbi:peptidase M6 [Clostridium sp. P21]|uniref:Peptidase M6 n=1 Tax=Clostridium muellerianum TaxID=2716538 RepID=A0A7Y0EFI9_9CLOT|nr:immune inhibitor A domain-containing protein [Clostridium muellerianum]NMM62559.1 peptidase M6 [Clostridium muellerianum]